MTQIQRKLRHFLQFKIGTLLSFIFNQTGAFFFIQFYITTDTAAAQAI